MIKSLIFKKIFIAEFFLFVFIFNINVCLASDLPDNLNRAFNIPLFNAAENAGYNINQTGPESMISKVITTALEFVGVIFLVLAIYGGYIWMIARGNEQEIEKAKNTLIAAIIGMVIVVAAYAISYYVINALGGAALKAPTSEETNNL